MAGKKKKRRFKDSDRTAAMYMLSSTSRRLCTVESHRCAAALRSLSEPESCAVNFISI